MGQRDSSWELLQDGEAMSVKTVKEALSGIGFEALDEVLDFHPQRHHPFCNFFSAPAEGCPQCERLNRKFPVKEGESHQEAVDRILRDYFPDAVVVG